MSQIVSSNFPSTVATDWERDVLVYFAYPKMWPRLHRAAYDAAARAAKTAADASASAAEFVVLVRRETESQYFYLYLIKRF